MSRGPCTSGCAEPSSSPAEISRSSGSTRARWSGRALAMSQKARVAGTSVVLILSRSLSAGRGTRPALVRSLASSLASLVHRDSSSPAVVGLADGGARDVVGEVQLSGHLVPRDLGAAELLHVG